MSQSFKLDCTAASAKLGLVLEMPHENFAYINKIVDTLKDGLDDVLKEENKGATGKMVSGLWQWCCSPLWNAHGEIYLVGVLLWPLPSETFISFWTYFPFAQEKTFLWTITYNLYITYNLKYIKIGCWRYYFGLFFLKHPTVSALTFHSLKRKLLKKNSCLDQNMINEPSDMTLNCWRHISNV